MAAYTDSYIVSDDISQITYRIQKTSPIGLVFLLYCGERGIRGHRPRYARPPRTPCSVTDILGKLQSRLTD